MDVDNSSAYVLLAKLLIGGALFVVNGMRLKRRDVEALRLADRSLRRHTAPHEVAVSGGYSSASHDITGEIVNTR